jgi:DNA-binding CsgD family transcriptional regulator/PAS domain-containing protein
MNGISPERLSDLIGGIYDCAIAPDGWPQTLREICSLMNCMAGAIQLADLTEPRVEIFRSWGIGSDWIERYYNYADDLVAVYRGYADIDELPVDEPLVLSRHPGGPPTDSNRIFREWAKPQGMCDGIQAIVLRERGRIGTLGLNRHETAGLATDREVDILRLLAPHIRRAVTISDVMDLKTLSVDALATTLDSLSAGVIVVADGNRILHANESARRMFAAHGPVVSRRGKLAASYGAGEADMAEAIALAQRNEAGIGAAGIDVALRGPAGEPAIAHVLPLARGDLRTRLVPRATAAIFVTQVEEVPPPGLAALAASFALTPAEGRMLRRLAAGATMAEAGAALGVSLATAKTHIRHIFAKTSTSRQADLIALIHRLAPPVRGSAGG